MKQRKRKAWTHIEDKRRAVEEHNEAYEKQIIEEEKRNRTIKGCRYE